MSIVGSAPHLGYQTIHRALSGQINFTEDCCFHRQGYLCVLYGCPVFWCLWLTNDLSHYKRWGTEGLGYRDELLGHSCDLLCHSWTSGGCRAHLDGGPGSLDKHRDLDTRVRRIAAGHQGDCKHMHDAQNRLSVVASVRVSGSGIYLNPHSRFLDRSQQPGMQCFARFSLQRLSFFCSYLLLNLLCPLHCRSRQRSRKQGADARLLASRSLPVSSLCEGNFHRQDFGGGVIFAAKAQSHALCST
mmetsp:Transcript_41131/g.64258  ORF Transcript_41131/g.64258 Transcript_41131/m.64258 type:complete len:244 (+) Transcript_41131:418-1149(+)